MKNLPKVYILIVNYNRWEDTIKCIESLLQIEYSNYQIIVIDNCSTDNSIVRLKEWIKNINKSELKKLFYYIIN